MFFFVQVVILSCMGRYAVTYGGFRWFQFEINDIQIEHIAMAASMLICIRYTLMLTDSFWKWFWNGLNGYLKTEPNRVFGALALDYLNTS